MTLCVWVPSAVGMRFWCLMLLSYEHLTLLFLFLSHLLSALLKTFPPHPKSLKLTGIRIQSLTMTQASQWEITWLNYCSMAYIPDTKHFLKKYNHLTLPHLRLHPMFYNDVLTWANVFAFINVHEASVD